MQGRFDVLEGLGGGLEEFSGTFLPVLSPLADIPSGIVGVDGGVGGDGGFGFFGAAFGGAFGDGKLSHPRIVRFGQQVREQYLSFRLEHRCSTRYGGVGGGR